MFAVFIMLTPGCRNEFIDSQKVKVRRAVLPIMDVMTYWNMTLDSLERAYRLRDFTPEWLYNPKFSDYQPVFTTQDQWTIVE